MKKKTFYIFEGDTLAYSLAKKLLLLGNEVYYISKKKENIELMDGLKAYYSSLELINNDPTDIDWVENLEMTSRVGALIIISENDSENFVISWLLRQYYEDIRIVSLVNSPENEFMFKTINVNTLTPISWMEKLIEASLNYEDITDFFNPYVEKLSILELLINIKDKSCNKKLKNIKLPENTIIGVQIKSDGEIKVPQGESIIEENDKIIVFSLKEQVQKVKEALK
ncbi:NAD-binding protein [Oceanotoga sp. DSM 15011]|jgi:trk system potassium uptake protein TrkA|uniref:Trk system potassium uptake protein TrkA n=1 Tax=Oceanotoga teriensis TaxID=515440 RepID=A0AA45C4N1_9BACT|nr:MULTISPECIES: TrkA C-terminal domain-containing protein [Oceanotoga]MDN5343573.1 trk/ktr system potassium uptake protein [Oceanotoga sp.]MDO7977302.1 NAD-binding protein [Oceanotoga teriensis]PWJ86721.1 trk system potassium uptake protein TrkA [Oceanotoga teriensis]UYP00478.1 NAD-binding protein [Oceanotoga sp. DSM 15011]